MEFIIGIYEADSSGETDMMSIRGSGRDAGSSGPTELEDCVETLVRRLMSVRKLWMLNRGWSESFHVAYNRETSSKNRLAR